MEESQFDVEGARWADAIPMLPHTIPRVVGGEVPGEHEDEGPVDHRNAPPLVVTTGLPNEQQHPPLNTAFSAFQEEENRRFRPLASSFVSRADVELGPEDYNMDSDQDSEDDSSMDQDSENESKEPNSRPAGPLEPQMQDRVQVKFERRSVAEKPLEAWILEVNEEKVEEVQYCENFPSGSVNVLHPDHQNEDLRGAEGVSMTGIDQLASPVLPPIEEKFTKELTTQIDITPFSAEAASVVAPSPLPSSQLPSASGLKICQSILEPIPNVANVAGVDGASKSEDSTTVVKEAACCEGSSC